MNKQKYFAIVVAAGKGTRVGTPIPKQLLKIGNKTILEKSAEAFVSHEKINGVCIVSPSDGSYAEEYDEIILRLSKNFSKDVFRVCGGKERSDSVKAGLFEIASRVKDDERQNTIVLIHDGARPYIDKKVIDNNINSMEECRACVTAVPSIDSVRIIDDRVLKDESRYPIIKSNVIERSLVYNIQTPQTFRLSDIISAYEYCDKEGYKGTDDASVAEFYGISVAIIEGSYFNSKITTPKDVPMTTRVGSGYDVHRLVPGRELILCGTPVPSELGLLGHSDADVATHAIMDALLGAAGMRDIGYHFPDSDEKYKGANSIELLKEVRKIIGECNINNIDVTIICERPKLSPYNEIMKSNIVSALGISDSAVNIKATTTEGLGFTGRGEGIAAFATCLIEGRF